MRIFLLGLPGSGKTTLGIQLAEKLDLAFLDLDAEIEKTQEKTIPEIFKLEGEEQFRVYEKEELQKSFSSNDVIISTGGGAPCFFDNIEQMNAQGTTIFIDVSPDELIRRMLDGSQEDRPLLAGKSQEDLKQELEEKRSARLPFYSQATHQITGDNITVDQLLSTLK